MDFVSNQQEQIQQMIKLLGIASIEELFDSIPRSLVHPAPDLDDGLSELEVIQKMEKIGLENTYSRFDSYLGAGAYLHHVPALVNAVISRSEFLTAYTPYQPEVSQGMLQAIFEFQSSIASLTGLDAVNASVYDGASACAEAVLMALRIKKEKKSVVLLESVHPLYQAVIKQYLSGMNVPIIPYKKWKNSSCAACLVAQSPNFFGILEEMKNLAHEAHQNEALFIAVGNPLAYALLQPPGECEADIAVGDCQPLGLKLNFGGPYAGYMACRQEFVRQLPGRIVGETVDSKGNRGFVLTLQAREQHIRREKATSNICTNQALSALASLITILWYGPKGLKQLALTNYQRAHYLSSALEKLEGFSIAHPFFNEFTLTCPCSAEEALMHFREADIEPGVPLNRFFPHMDRHLLIAVTELKSLEQLNKFIAVASKL